MLAERLLSSTSLAAVEALLFDFDGVVVDSEPLHTQAKQQMLDSFNIAAAATLFDQFKGRPDRVFFEFILNEQPNLLLSVEDLDRTKRQAYLNLITDLKLIPDVLPFIEAVSQVVPHLALVTSATQHDLQLAFERFELEQWFEVVVHGDMVTHPKPHPEPYLKALNLLGRAADRCVVIEDSPNGIRAAKAAGCQVIGITTSFDATVLQAAEADDVVSSFQTLIDRLAEQP